MSTIRAWQITQRGWLPDTIQLSSKVLTPKPSAAGEVQVQVNYAALNPVDPKLASLFPSFIQKLPRTPASDFSGVITAVGPGTQPPWVKPGARVYGFFSPATSYKDQKGSLQEIITVPAKLIQPTPDDFTDADVAGLTLVGLTALALTEAIKQGDRVLIVGGSTAVGLLAADIAIAKGASFIVATASGEKADFVKGRGVHDTVDYRQTDAGVELARRYKKEPFNLVLDCVGQPAVHRKCAQFLVPTGTYFSLAASTFTAKSTFTSPEVRAAIAWNLKAALLPSFLGGVPRKFKELNLDDSRIEELGILLKAGKLHPVVDREFAFEDVPEAYRYLIEGRATGKIIVKVAPTEPTTIKAVPEKQVTESS